MKRDKAEVINNCNSSLKDWQNDLPEVLDLIRTNSARIVDSTSMDKVLHYIAKIARDEKKRHILLQPSAAVVKFLSPPFQTIFASSTAASFALELSGIIAGSSTEACKVLDNNGTLDAMFGESFHRIDTTELWKDGHVKYAFFAGLSSMLGSHAGYNWIKTKDFVQQATNAITDTNIHVNSSACKFIEKLLLVAEDFKLDSVSMLKDDDLFLKAIFSRNVQDQPCVLLCYFEILSQLLDVNTNIAMKFFRNLPTFQNLVQYGESALGYHPRIIQMVIFLSGKLVRTNWDNNFPWYKICSNETLISDDDAGITEVFMSLALSLASIEAKHGINLLLNLPCNEVSSKNTPMYWNELLLHLVINCMLTRVSTEERITSRWLMETLASSRDNSLSDHLLQLLNNLESTFKGKQRSIKVWRDNLKLVLNIGKDLFSEKVRDSCGVEVKRLVERFCDYIIQIMVIAAKPSYQYQQTTNSELFDTFTGCIVFANPCSYFIKEMIINGWYNDFSLEAKKKLIDSIFEVLADSTINAQTLTCCIKLLSHAIESCTDIIEMVFCASQEANVSSSFTGRPEKIASVMEGLLLDPRWEVQDSVLDLITLMVRAGGKSCRESLHNFLKDYQFWLKAFDLLDAEESYIRASAVSLLGFFITTDTLRATFTERTSIDSFLNKLVSILASDDEAFPKRSVMDMISHWLSMPGVQKEILAAKSTNEIMHPSKQPEDARVLKMILLALKKAASDFDWEVKKTGVVCWCKILRILNVCDKCQGEQGHPSNIDMDNTNFELCSSNHFKSGTGALQMSDNLKTLCNCKSINNAPTISAQYQYKIHEEKLKLFCSLSGAGILVQSINDCDQLVKEAAYTGLRYIKESILKELVSSETYPTKSVTSYHDLERNTDVSDAKNFLKLILSIDFVELGKSILPNDAENEFASLLKDILSASRYDDNNLLDCY